MSVKSRKDSKGRVLRKGESFQKSKGIYIYSFTDPFGKRKYIYSKDLTALREKEENLKRDQLDGLDIYIMKKATLNYCFERYMSSKVELRETTRYNYLYTYNTYVKDKIGNKLIADFKYSDILFFYIYLVEKQGLSISTVESVHTVLRPTFNLALRDDIIRRNPTEGAMADLKRKLRSSVGKRHALTIEQERAFICYFDDKPDLIHWRNLFMFLLGTGCRIGEAVGIRWDDVDLKNRVVHINHSVSYYPREQNSYKCDYEVSKPKTGAGVRDIPMFQSVYNALMSEREVQRKTGIYCTAEIDGLNNFIFYNRYGSIHNPAGVNRAIKRYSSDYNMAEAINAKKQKRDAVILPNFSCHVLRHTFCTRLCETETNLKYIQEIMGHTDIKTTLDIYAEIQEHKKREITKKIEGGSSIIFQG